MKRRVVAAIGVALALYFATAYVVLPWAWQTYAKRHPAFDSAPRLTRTGDDHPGDPLNVALVGSEADVERIMTAAQWYRANPLSLRSDVKIAEDTMLKRPYDEAPVSNLYLFGRKEDLAFEKPVGDDPRKRNHVRFWRAEQTYEGGRPIWIGAASFDERVGLSYTTGQITHHIAPDVDAERDRLAADLQATEQLSQSYKMPGFHTVLEGRNGGGDRWHTDGALWVGVIAGK